MTNQSNQWSIVIALIIIAVVIGCGIYFWQNPETEQKTSSVTDCSTLGSSWTRFSDSETSLSFCYNNAWGTPELKETGISPEARIGSIYHISFTKSVSNHPLISYSTLDFQKTGDSDVPPGIDWKELDFNKSETELAKLADLFPGDNVVAQKLLVNGKNVLKINGNFATMEGSIARVDYFIPNVLINDTMYNLHMIGSPEQEADLDKLLDSIDSTTMASESIVNAFVVRLEKVIDGVMVSEGAVEESDNGADVKTWKTYENTEYDYSISYPKEYKPSGTTGSYNLKKAMNDSVQILSLTADNHKQLEMFEFSGETGWYDWARAGFPKDDSTAGSLSYNKRIVTLGDNDFTVVNYDGASSWGGAPFYYLVTDSTVFLLIVHQGLSSNTSDALHEQIVGTFSLSTSDQFAK